MLGVVKQAESDTLKRPSITMENLKALSADDAIALMKSYGSCGYDMSKLKPHKVVVYDNGWFINTGDRGRKHSLDKCEECSRCHKHCECECDDEDDSCRSGCCCGIKISSDKVNRHGAGYVINKPGEYTLSEDIVYDPVVPGTAAIVINANNVTLHLCHKVLRQSNENTQPNTVGILINGRKNISIDGGTIKNFSSLGIISNPGTNILSLSNLKVIGCGTQGIGEFIGGIQLLISDNVRIENVSAVENIGIGISAAGCNNLYANRCFCDDMRGSEFGFGPALTRAAGFVVTPFPVFPASGPLIATSRNIKLLDSTFNRTTASVSTFGALIIGFNSVTDIKDILVESCVSMGNTGGAFSDENEGIGIVGTNIVVRNCVVSDITAPSSIFPFSGLARGFRVSGSNILYENCTASNITGNGPAAAVGFSGEYSCNNAIWKGCTALDIRNTGTPDLFLGNADAYGFGGIIRGSIFAQGIIGGGIFDFKLGLSNTWQSCSSSGAVATGGGIGAAFSIASQKNANIQKCVANRASHFGFRFNNAADDVGNPVLSSNAIVKSNTIYDNVSVGIMDATAGNNAYIANIARSNTTNYVGLPAGTPIRTWVLPGPPSPIDSNGILDPQLDNMDIQP